MCVFLAGDTYDLALGNAALSGFAPIPELFLLGSFLVLGGAYRSLFGLYPGLTHGATTAIEGHGSDALKQAYLPKMVSGQWSGTMCLTEPHCGTDLGLLRSRAVPQGDGSYKVTGSKIFISAGEHDLTENIIHLVLARLPDAPKGVKGISLFLVPKYLPREDGTPGQSNGVACAAIEHPRAAGPRCRVTRLERRSGVKHPRRQPLRRRLDGYV